MPPRKEKIALPQSRADRGAGSVAASGEVTPFVAVLTTGDRRPEPGEEEPVHSPLAVFRRGLAAVLGGRSSSPAAPRFLRGALAATTFLIVGALVVSFALSLREGRNTAAVAPSAPNPELAIDNVLTAEEVDAARDTVLGYLAAPTVDEKLAFLRRPDRVREKVEAFFGSSERLSPVDLRDVGHIRFARKSRLGEIEAIVLVMNIPADGDPVNFTLEKVDAATYKIDWESSEGYQEIPLEKFQTERPVDPTPFRVNVEPDDFYNYGFSEDEYQSYRLTYLVDPDFKIVGYVRKDSDAARRLEEFFPGFLKSPPSIGLILSLSYPPESTLGSKNLVVINSIVFDQWVVP